MSMFSRCALCQRMLLPPEERRGACVDCASRTGAITMPPPRRRIAPCGKCSHTKLVRVIPRERLADHAGPMYAAYRYPIGDDGAGMFEIYVCKQCGFAEWYCHAPEEIPIGPEYMTEEVDVGGEGPYR